MENRTEVIEKLKTAVAYIATGFVELYESKNSVIEFPYNSVFIYPPKLQKGFNALLELHLLCKLKPPVSIHDFILNFAEVPIHQWEISRTIVWEEYDFPIFFGNIPSEGADELMMSYRKVTSIEDEKSTQFFIDEIRNLASQDNNQYAYIKTRKWLIEHPYINDGIRGNLKYEFRCYSSYSDLIENAYQKVEKQSYKICPNCNNIMIKAIRGISPCISSTKRL